MAIRRRVKAILNTAKVRKANPSQNSKSARKELATAIKKVRKKPGGSFWMKREYASGRMKNFRTPTLNAGHIG